MSYENYIGVFLDTDYGIIRLAKIKDDILYFHKVGERELFTLPEETIERLFLRLFSADCSVKKQPHPTESNDSTNVIDLVQKDLKKRAETGNKRYGTYLKTHNGREPLIDLYQELLDAVMYIRQFIEEQNDMKFKIGEDDG